MFLLDTDILIYSLKGDSAVLANFKKYAAEPKAVSVITYGELVFGAQGLQRVTENLAKVYRLKEIFPLVNVTPAIMDIFGALLNSYNSVVMPIWCFHLNSYEMDNHYSTL